MTTELRPHKPNEMFFKRSENRDDLEGRLNVSEYQPLTQSTDLRCLVLDA